MRPLLSLLLLPAIAFAQGSECKIGGPCTVRGVLRIYMTPPAPTGLLETEGMCIPLALSADVFADYKRWKDRPVTVVGLVYAHGVADGVLTYRLEGRDVIGSLCRSSPIALFVTELKAE
jgi:hypothetical protein